MVVAKYPLSQAASCETMRVLWINCKNNIGPMHDAKALLTEEYCDQQIELIDASDGLPDEAARTMIHEMLRAELVTEGKACTRKWQFLKMYINGVFAGEQARITQYNGAGWEHYESAAAQSWQDVNDLMQGGSNYIAANTATLKGPDNKNMPDTFPSAFNLAWETFQTKRTAFIKSLNDTQVATANKVTAINTCYDSTVMMDELGQTVFQDDEELKRLFSFEAMGAVVEPAGPASYELTVEVGGVAKAGAEVRIDGTNKQMVTGADGKALFAQMHAGAVSCTIVCDGFPDQHLTSTLEAGVRRRVTVTLEPLFDGALKVGSEKTEAAETPVPEAAGSGSMQ